MDEAKLALRHFVREKLNIVKSSECALDLTEVLTTLSSLLNGQPKSMHLSGIDDSALKQLFIQNHYNQVIVALVSKLSVDWITLLPKGRTEALIDVFFLEGDPASALTVLCSTINTNRLDYKVQKCVTLLETFIKSGKLRELMWRECECGKDAATLAKASTTSEKSESAETSYRVTVDANTQHRWDSLVTVIASIPDRVTAKLGKETSAIFYPPQYIKYIGESMTSSLEGIYRALVSGATSSVSFLSQILAKFCLTGYADSLWMILQRHFLSKSADNFLWSRIYEKLMTRVPDRAMESVVVPVLQHVPWYGHVDRLLGNSVVTSHKLRHLLTNKLVLLRTFKDDLFLQNLIGYLSSSSRKQLHTALLKRVLEVWGDRSALKHTSYEQHKYISKAILIGLAFTSESDVAKIQNDLLSLMMAGVQVHLDSPLPDVRRLGMLVAEAVTDKLSLSEQRLKFEYEQDDEVRHLKSLLELPVKPDVTETVSMETLNIKTEEEKTTVKTKKEPKMEETSDLDSDDEFEAYDMSNDRQMAAVKPPLYVRDCMEGLLNSEKPDRVEVCLKTANVLIRKHTSTVKEIAVEFCKVLLHLEDTMTILGFILHRHAAMVALAVTAPVKVTEYLTKEFYERNYNIRQRLDILEVLASAAQELSAPSGGDSSKNSVAPSKVMVIDEAEVTSLESEVKDWREIVQRRIDGKTRRFAHGRQHPAPQAAANRFAPVAGHFFFPLMAKFDSREPCLDLLGDDHLVLSRLLYTLGLIMYCALHAPIARQMAGGLFEFIWALQYHAQPSVKRALIYAVSMVMLAVPSHVLLSDLQSDVIQAKHWLQDVIETEADDEVKKMALQALVLMENVAKQEFQSEGS